MLLKNALYRRKEIFKKGNKTDSSVFMRKKI